MVNGRHVQHLRAALWALRAVAAARRQLHRNGLDGFSLPAPPPVAFGATRGVDAVLDRLRPTCLERALVLQRWLRAHGERRDVIVGVAGARRNFRAHAWLDGDPARAQGDFVEIARLTS